MPGLHVSTRAPRRRPPAATAQFRKFVDGAEQAIARGTADADQVADRVARARLPRRGGFADYMARRLEVHRSRVPGGTRLTFDAKGTDAARINRGRLRHEVWGNREVWVTQTIHPGFADEAVRLVKASVDRELHRLVR
jgi:hypothetical protein